MSSLPPLPARAMREHLGHKSPDITRKVTACVACRKQKIKCHMGADGTCSRCQRRGLPCAVNKSLQMILESDADWKDAVESKLQLLQTGLSQIAQHLNLDPVDFNTDEHVKCLIKSSKPITDSPTRFSSSANIRSSPCDFELVMDPESGPATIPGSVVSPVQTGDINSAYTKERDIIGRGIISYEKAERFLDIYQDRLDHFLYRILGERRSLDLIRAASPVLLTSICAVGALHLASSPDFEVCHREFLAVAAAQTFSTRNNIDDIRGLCIAAFWLSDISWKCIGLAVRMATELGLHRSIFKALNGDRTHYLRTRVYYLVYVCDHQFSIAYGRPPMTRQDDAIRSIMQFLNIAHTLEDDARLVSQVQFWSVINEIYECFGVDVERPLDITMVEPLRRFSIRLDRIRADWTERFSHNEYVGNYPRKGVGLHYHFSKLYLYSMAFRGIGRPTFRTSEVALDIDELANSALLSANAILRAVITDTEIQGYLNGLPTYFDVMIAFAVVFVLKVSTKYASLVGIDTSESLELVTKLVKVLKRLTGNMHRRHLLVSVANGAEKLLSYSSSVLKQSIHSSSSMDGNVNQPRFRNSSDEFADIWQTEDLEHLFINEFDFLSASNNQVPFLLGFEAQAAPQDR